ncbi:MAG: transcriptional regulator [Candidatus Moranbacteria bacterium GW2011_GWF2_36_839]|nr:MAG: transcriptional regulator [Candidatus Moranbacteria bacterium GW2011_GWF1_36_78]KKQ17055.1 MAG: transcriptional regulator [Candidatus Moranbacteria bacterium GW2011_GWF2_36_839]
MNLMSGHSHWAGIKQRKGVNDAKRAKIFTKLAKPIVIAAREGGGNPDTNFKLRMAMKKAQEFNMPKDNIDKAVKKGTGEMSGAEIVEIIYEAKGPGNIMMLIKTSTDNKNRTVSEIKSILTKAGGKFGESGSSMWNFEQVGEITIDLSGKDADELEMLAIEAGAKDTKIEDGLLFIYTETQDLQKVQEKLSEKNIEISQANLTFLPKSTVEIDSSTQESYDKLLEILDDQEDVEEIFDNFLTSSFFEKSQKQLVILA